MILLDTSAVIQLLRGETPPEQIQNDSGGISSIVQLELMRGVYHKGGKKELLLVDEFLDQIEIFAFDSEAAIQTAKIMTQLWKAGTPIGDFDSQIAGHALALNLPLATYNIKHFERIPKLELIEWK